MKEELAEVAYCIVAELGPGAEDLKLGGGGGAGSCSYRLMTLASTGVGRLSLLLPRFDSFSRGGLSAVDLRIRSLTVEEVGDSSTSSARSGIVSVVGWRMLLPE